jgi:hypothetical protein
MGSLLRFKLDDFLSNYHLQTFIETGTARGDSLDYAAQRPEFSHLLSCEIEPLLAAGACCRFNEDARISVVRMESGLFMQMVARADLAPAFIWLDAHYPGAGFGLKDYGAAMPETVRLPLGRELDQIRQHRQGRDVILIDDLRIYETGDYEAGPLPEDAPGQPTEGGADWIRALFADTHEARTILRDQGYLLLLPKPAA